MTEKQLTEGQRLLNIIHDLQEDRNKIVEALNDDRQDGREAERIFESMLYHLDYPQLENKMKILAEIVTAELDSEIISLKKKFEEL